MFFPQNNKSYQPLSDSSDNNNKSHFHPDSNSDFLGQRQTDRQTDRRPADVYNQAMEPDKFRSIYGNSHL